MIFKGMKGKNKKQLFKRVLRYLSRNRLMALGTARNNKPWLATVFFAYDQNCNILFYSREDTRHCQYIAKNPHVSIAINEDHGTAGFIKGLQTAGKASKVRQRDYKKYYAIYKKRFPWADTFASDHILYIIKSTELHLIDQKFFGHFFRVRIL